MQASQSRTADPGICIRHIRSPADFTWRDLAQLADLLAACFYEDGEPWQLGERGGARSLGGAAFGWTSLAFVLFQHAVHGGGHVTILAELEGELAGCCGCTVEQLPADVAEAVAGEATSGGSEASNEAEGVAAGGGRRSYCLLTGLGVDPRVRCRGVASALLAAAGEEAEAALGRGGLLALLVARTNVAALRLYERCGLQQATRWEDARWAEEAERGKVGRPRRLLLVRRVGPGGGEEG